MTPDTAAVQGYTPEWFAGLSDSTLARTLEQARKEMVAKRKEYEDATNHWSRLLAEHYRRREVTLSTTTAKEDT